MLFFPSYKTCIDPAGDLPLWKSCLRTPDEKRLVGGLEHQFLFSHINWVSNHPNWRTHIFQRGGPGPPTRECGRLAAVAGFSLKRRSSDWARRTGNQSLPWGNRVCKMDQNGSKWSIYRIYIYIYINVYIYIEREILSLIKWCKVFRFFSRYVHENSLG